MSWLTGRMQLGHPSGGGASAALMAVAMENFLNSATNVQTSLDSFMMFRPYTIGSGDVNGIRFSFHARRLAPGGAASVATAAYVVSSCYINNAAQNVQSPLVTFGGNSTLSVASGAYDQQSDLILPSALGLSAFVQGSIVWLKCIWTFAAGADIGSSTGLTGNWAGTAQGNVQFFGFLAANTTPTNVSTAGKFTWTGTSPSPESAGPAVDMLGTFVTPGAALPVYFCAGDSIMYGLADTGTAGAVQRGIFNRAIWDNGTAARKMACMNTSVSGLIGTAYTQDAFPLAMSKYCNRGVVEVGTNDFGATGTGNTPAVVEATRTAIYTALRSANPAMKIIDTLLGPRTTCAVAVSALSGDGTTVTLTTTTAFVASIGGVGATRTCAVAGGTGAAAGYNTIPAGVTMTVASTTAVTYANATTAALAGTVTISDLWQTETNQTFTAPVSGTGWAPGGNIDTFNTWVLANGNEAHVDFTYWHGVNPRMWANESGVPITIDGLHPNGATPNSTLAAQLRVAMDALA